MFFLKRNKDFGKENDRLNIDLRYKRAWQAKPNSSNLFGTKKSNFMATTTKRMQRSPGVHFETAALQNAHLLKKAHLKNVLTISGSTSLKVAAKTNRAASLIKIVEGYKVV
jgi:hypothetical protein